MDLSAPAHAIIPTLDADVLTVLAGVTKPLTGRQISRMIEAKSHRGVGLVLERLRSQGVVDAVEAGSSYLYTLNREHVTFPAIEALTDLRGKLYSRMTVEIKTWQILPVSVAVFGSAARGDGGIDSDIDILIVRQEELYPNNLENFEIEQNEGEEVYWDLWAAQLSEFGSKVRRWSGNTASLIQATQSQLVAMVERNEPIVASLQRDARYLWGPKIMKTLMDQK
ncbi:MAG TPA: nucleotidyltransferase domain-containing protein [Candidatus Paceibacterota bacterium]|nr:nucleotidyltransferase domain-containing protein [Candidatus Paceibacterota bacterium]